MSLNVSAIRPDFIIIGSMKSGTTTLYRSLASHPEIGMSRDKETDFFIEERNFRRGPNWYSDQFTAGFARYGEASPNYTKADDFKGVPSRIKRELPNAKLIYVVRDPVDRFVSQYRHSWTIGDIAMPPAELPSTSEYAHILNVSRYALQMRAYLDEFDARQILVVDFRRLTRDKVAAMNEIHDFIGVSRHVESEAGAFNDNAEISRIPAFALRFAQSNAGRSLSHLLGRQARDRIRGLLARGKARQPPPFPPQLLTRVREDLAQDAKEFRDMTGMAFKDWSL